VILPDLNFTVRVLFNGDNLGSSLKYE